MNENTAAPRRFYRSRRDRVLAGVAGGLGQYFGVDPVLFRLIFVAVTFANGFGLLAYIILALVVPNRPEGEAEPEPVGGPAFNTTRGQEIAGIALIGFGLVLLASTIGVFSIVRWDLVWPVVLIAFGAFLMINRSRG